MAYTAKELFQSRTGDVSADRAGYGASRLFAVGIESPGENPDDILRDVDKVGTDSVPFGAPHPTRPGLFSAFYITDRRLTGLTYSVRVVYAPPVDFTTDRNPWELTYAPGFGSSTVHHDWLGNPIGPATYELLELGEVPPNPVNAKIYSITLPGDGRNRNSEEVFLVRSDAADGEQVRKPIFLHDAQRTEPLGSFTMSKTFHGMNELVMAGLVGISNIVNKTTFMGFAPRTVKFVGPSAQAGEGIVPDTNSQGYVWRISLAFEWNPLGHRWRAQDFFDINGQRLPVNNEDGSPVIREWVLYPEGDLSAIPPIVEQFGSPLQAQRIGDMGIRSAGRPRTIGGG